jgi:hypothetical protein
MGSPWRGIEPSFNVSREYIRRIEAGANYVILMDTDRYLSIPACATADFLGRIGLEEK